MRRERVLRSGRTSPRIPYSTPPTNSRSPASSDGSQSSRGVVSGSVIATTSPRVIPPDARVQPPGSSLPSSMLSDSPVYPQAVRNLVHPTDVLHRNNVVHHSPAYAKNSAPLCPAPAGASPEPLPLRP